MSANEPHQPPVDTPLSEFTPAQLHFYIDTHLIDALEAAHQLHYEDRQAAEDHVRDRVVAVHDTWITQAALHAERWRRTSARLRAMLSVSRSERDAREPDVKASDWGRTR